MTTQRRSVPDMLARMESFSRIVMPAMVGEMMAAAYALAAATRAHLPTARLVHLKASARGDSLVLDGWEDDSGHVRHLKSLPGGAAQAADHLFIRHIGDGVNIGAVPGLRADGWGRRRFVLDIDQVLRECDTAPPVVETLVVRDPDGPTSVDVAVAGVAVEAGQVAEFSVDPGAGWTWEDWAAHRDHCLSQASPALLPAVRSAFSCPPGGEYVEGRGERGWLEGVVLSVRTDSAEVTHDGPAAVDDPHDDGSRVTPDRST